jgi:hypothetical protein
MTSLLDFPNELILQIFSNFDRKDDQKTIQALRHTNNRLRNLTKTMVYLTVADQISYPPRDEEGAKNIGPLQRRTRELVRHPELSYFVKSIQLSAWDRTGKDQLLTRYSPRLELYSKALQRVDMPDMLRQNLLTGLQDETPQGNLALLLTFYGDLEVLNIKSGFPGFGQLVGEVFRQAAALHYHWMRENKLRGGIPRPVILRSLKEISFGSLNATSISDVLLLLSLPSLQTLRVSDLYDNHHHQNHDMPPEDEICRNNNPLKLIFDTCVLSGAGIGRVLRACSRPQSLTVRWRPGAWNDSLSNPDIGEAVRQFGNKLEHLHLDTTPVYEHRYRQKPPAFGSFTELTNVRTLAVPQYAFTGKYVDAVSALPSSLNRLYVLGIDDSQMQDGLGPFQRLIGNDGLPKLEEVKHLNWFQFSLEEWFGTASHRSIDYDGVKELELKTSGK